jgi:hypothetical protein
VAGSNKSQEIVVMIRAMAIVALLFSWIAYFWERWTGVTFVFSKSSRAVGYISTAQHLSSTLHATLGATVVCVILIFALRQRSE